MKLSVVVPTRNRAALWRSGWLLDSLRAQSEPPDELVVAVDHPDDDTLTAVIEAGRRIPFPVRILEILAPRRGPNPASAVPDDCLIAASRGDILIHLDDDLSVGSHFCRRLRTLLDCDARAVIWPQLHFVNPDHSPISDAPPQDSRSARAARMSWRTLPGGLIEMPRTESCHWGGAWAVKRAELLKIGGHCLQLAPFRNSDTRLGNRLVRSGCSSFLGAHRELVTDHLGQTWFSTHRSDKEAIRVSRGATHGITIANGGQAFWTSTWIRDAFRELDITTGKPII